MRIENLSKELDTKTMTAVRGGDNGNSASNVIGQAMSLGVPVGVAGAGNSSVSVTGSQNGSIYNGQFGGDFFLAFPVSRYSDPTVLQAL